MTVSSLQNRLRIGSRATVSPWPLAALTLVVMLLAVTGAVPRWPGLVHLVALPPLGLLADLRILVVHASGYPVFLLGLVEPCPPWRTALGPLTRSFTVPPN